MNALTNFSFSVITIIIIAPTWVTVVVGTTYSITTIDPITVNVGVIQMDKSKQAKGGGVGGEGGEGR